MSKIGKVVDQLQPLPRWKKKDGELWYTNKKLQARILTHPKQLCAYFVSWRKFIRHWWLCCARHCKRPKLSLQSDLRRRAALRWALSHISSNLISNSQNSVEYRITVKVSM